MVPCDILVASPDGFLALCPLLQHWLWISCRPVRGKVVTEDERIRLKNEYTDIYILIYLLWQFKLYEAGSGTLEPSHQSIIAQVLGKPAG